MSQPDSPASSSSGGSEYGTPSGAASAAGTSAAPSRRPSLSVRSKFLIMLLLTSLLSIAVVSILSYQSGKAALTESIFKQLTSLRSGKKQQVEWYFVFDVWGQTANVARRLVYEAEVNGLSISSESFDLLGQPIELGEPSTLKTKTMGTLTLYRDQLRQAVVSKPAKETDRKTRAAE